MKSKSIRGFLIAGLVVWLPILITIGVFRFLIDLLDQTLSFIPTAYQPEHWLGMDIPGLGVILSFVILVTTGIFATNFLGQRFMIWGEAVLARIPLVRSVYNSVKQLIHTVLSTNSDAFRKVLLIQYPREGLWTIAFQTGSANLEINKKTNEEMVSLFVPTTPNPTSGFFLMIPKKEAIELNMSIDEALKLIISLGVMQPEQAAAQATLK